MRIFLSLILSLIFAIPRAEATSKILQISEQEMRELLANPAIRRHTILLTENDNPKKKVEEEEEKRKSSPDHASFPTFQGSGHSSFGSMNSADEAAAIVFAVIGLVAVIAWIGYFPEMAYEAIKHGGTRYNFPQQVSLETVVMEGNKTLREGYLSGITYNAFLEEKKDPFFQTGVGSEIGYFNLHERKGAKKRSEGGFWLFGPSIRIGEKEKGHLRLDLLAGSSFDRDLGVLTKAQVAMDFYEGDYIIGLHFGALYAHLKSNKGIAEDITNTGLILGASFGRKF